MKIEEIFRKLKPISVSSLDELWREYILSDAKTQKNIEDVLRLVLAKNLGQTFEEKEVLLEPPSEQDAYGEYPLGIIYYGREKFHPFGLRENEWIQHVGIFGRSGSGKTNVAFLVVLNLLKHGKPFMVFDWKRNYRDLLSLEVTQDILVFTVGRSVSPFYFNPLIPPPGTPPTIWLKKIIEIAQHAYFLGEGVAYLLQKAIDTVYTEFGVYEGKNKTYPNLNDVKEWLENYRVKGRESAWMDSALRAVGVLCFGEVGKVLNRRENVPIEGLLEKNVILELDALTSSDKTFLIESLLLWIHHYRMAQGEREMFKHAILIEEAHHILLRKKQEVMGEETITDIILREIRELGEAIILLDQHPSLVSKPALGNTYTTIAMNLKHRSDIQMISDSLLLDMERTRYLGKLEIGVAMVKLQGRWFDPFLVRFPHVKIEKGIINDEEVARRMAGLFETSGEDFRKEAIIGLNSDQKEALRDFRGKEKGEEEGIFELADRLLKDVGRQRLSPASDRYRRLGINAYQGSKAKDVLLKKGLVEVKNIPTKTGRLSLMSPTEKGLAVLQEWGIKPEMPNRIGGPEHVLWKNRLAEYFRGKGYTVTEEKPIGGGRTVDLVAVNAKEKIAIEIETGKADAFHNLAKDLEKGFDKVIVVNLKKREEKRDLSQERGKDG
jgi:hypothetical protein